MEGDDPLPPSPHCGGVSFPRHPASSPDWPSAETGQNQLKCAPSTRSGKLWLFLHLRTQVPRAVPLPLRSHREDTDTDTPWGAGAISVGTAAPVTRATERFRVLTALVCGTRKPSGFEPGNMWSLSWVQEPPWDQAPQSIEYNILCGRDRPIMATLKLGSSPSFFCTS